MPTATYPADFHPDAINTRLVLRIYTWIVLTAGLLLTGEPLLLPGIAGHVDLPGVPWGRASLVRMSFAALTVFGFSALGMSRIEHPVSRRRALLWFAIGHLYFGLMFWAQSYAVFPEFIPRFLWWIPFTVGVVLLFIALTCAHAPRLHRPFRSLFAHDTYGPLLVERARESGAIAALRSQYEEHVRQAARIEERTRLARDLHDAVKQQLFVIQTSAATAQERFHSDDAGAQAALEQIRVSARDAMTEMRALIEQLQASPIENTGLVSALQQQCDALELQTGAHVTLETGALPPSDALLPGTQLALFRAAQEALSNVARHARATHVNMRLGVAGGRLELTIRDDGSGFDRMRPSSGMGLDNMKARVCEMAGTFLLQTSPGGGTLVGFSVPCDTRTASDYAKKTLRWTGVVALMAVSFTFGRSWERPYNAIVAAIAAITVARYVAAWWRTRGREGAALA
jgi:signal transduction histidine kinase